MLTKAQLRELYQSPSERSLQKQINRLEEQSRLFISQSTLIIVSTHGVSGRCDCSPRGGQPGFVHILSDTQIAIPDFRGNNRLDSLENIVDTGQIGCLFLVPGIAETLRINGSATVCADSEVIGQFSSVDPVKTYILVDVEEVYIHCGKALIRSAAWDVSTHVDAQEFPSLGAILNAQVGKKVMPESHSEIATIYRQTLGEREETN